MKKIIELANENVRNLAPPVHGGVSSNDIAQAGRKRDEILDFSANLNPLGVPRSVLGSLKMNLDQIYDYPDSRCTELGELVARKIDGVSKDNLIFGNGSAEVIYLFSEVFIKGGDKVVIPAPTFGEYEHAAKKRGARIEYTKLGEGFHLNPESILDKLSGAKAVFLCNPNNPTGALMKQEDILAIIDGASAEDAFVFLDEVFIDFVDQGDSESLAGDVEKYRNLFVLRSFTKIFGLAGLRVGFGVANRETIDLLHRAKIPWNVNILAQVAASAALNDLDFLGKTRSLIKEERAFLFEELRKINGFKVYPTDANFVFVDIRGSGYTAPRLKEAMLGHGIVIRDCSSYNELDEYYIRLAVRTRRENMRLIQVLRKVTGANDEDQQ